MGKDFKTHERKSERVCGECDHRLSWSGYCLWMHEVVRKTDPCDDCRHFEPSKTEVDK